MHTARIAVDIEIPGQGETTLSFEIPFHEDDIKGLSLDRQQEFLENLAYEEVKNRITITPRLVDVEPVQKDHRVVVFGTFEFTTTVLAASSKDAVDIALDQAFFTEFGSGDSLRVVHAEAKDVTTGS